GEGGGGEVETAPGASRPGLAALREGGPRLADRHVGRLVHEVEVDGVDSKPLEARLDLPQDAVAVKPQVRALRHRIERLRRDLRTPPSRREPPADGGLAPPAAVGVRRVEAPE